ncbi:flagellar motor switch phosphatase FliY [Pelotomaculum propionicicum]|uniref:flagellar motor switch phosphatase FliY n=1 Tax=Pelotomaculum propionicicum TaxID=258475 RepID=UPI003B77A771
MSRLLKQEEIDALLNAQNNETGHPEEPEDMEAAVPEEQLPEDIAEENMLSVESEDNTAAESFIPEQAVETDTAPVGALPDNEEEYLTEEEMDALGEVGNICMGSAATTLSMLLNQKVSITSPRITISTLEELFSSFIKPHMTIHVRFIEGLLGFNLLIMRVHDANVLADLMMGGEGVSVSEEIDEIGISAASEAMNQMIGSASTSMATMFNRTVNISPPETKVYYSTDDLNFPEFGVEGPVVIVWFNMKIGDILDTQLMQVMGFDTAKEEAGLILGELGAPDNVTTVTEVEEQPGQELSAGADVTGDNLDGLQDIEPEPAVFVEPVRQYEPPAVENMTHTPAAVRYAPPKPEPATYGFDQQRLDLILDIPLKVTVLLGRTRWPIKDILGLAPGSVVELQSIVDEPVEILVNGTLVATGEVVVVNENFGVRISNIIGPSERIKNLGT